MFHICKCVMCVTVQTLFNLSNFATCCTFTCSKKGQRDGKQMAERGQRDGKGMAKRGQREGKEWETGRMGEWENERMREWKNGTIQE